MVLELRNIEKSFGEKKVLTGVSFKAEGGQSLRSLGQKRCWENHVYSNFDGCISRKQR